MKTINQTYGLKRIMKLVASFILLLSFQIGYACSCHNGFTLCSLIDYGEDFVFIKTEVLEKINHPNGRHSVILKVKNNFISDIDLTDTIELIGGYEAACEKSLKAFQLGETRYIALIQPEFNIQDLNTIPITSDTYWRHSVFLCGILIFEETETQIVGPISDDFSSYPKELFDQNVIDCSFNNEDIESVNCPSLKIYPNPILNNQIFFEDIGARVVNNVSIYSFDGKLIFRHEEKLDDLVLSLPELNEKVIIIEYYCGTEKHLEKLFVN